jgi:hypothetical protein
MKRYDYAASHAMDVSAAGRSHVVLLIKKKRMLNLSLSKQIHFKK